MWIKKLTEPSSPSHIRHEDGTIVDATIVQAPSSTKNKEGKRDPEMHQVKKGNQWYYGMKIHSGVDARSGYVHTITATSANVHDIDEAAKLIREDDEVMYGDSGYSGMAKRPEVQADEHLSGMECRTNVRPSRIKVPDSYKGINWDKEIESFKSSTRCKVEHPFLIVKRQFGYSKAAYRGIAKNFNRFNVLFACANLVMCARAVELSCALTGEDRSELILRRSISGNLVKFTCALTEKLHERVN